MDIVIVITAFNQLWQPLLKALLVALVFAIFTSCKSFAGVGLSLWNQRQSTHLCVNHHSKMWCRRYTATGTATKAIWSTLAYGRMKKKNSFHRTLCNPVKNYAHLMKFTWLITSKCHQIYRDWWHLLVSPITSKWHSIVHIELFCWKINTISAQTPNTNCGRRCDDLGSLCGHRTWTPCKVIWPWIPL